MSAYGQIRAGSLVLYDQTIEANNVDLGNLKFANLSISGTTRLRTSSSQCILAFNHTYSKEDTVVVESVSGSSSSTLNTTDAYVSMNVLGSNGRVVRQTIPYIPHVVGGSTVVLIGAVLTTTSPSQPSNIRARVGLFDDVIDKSGSDSTGNGFFFQLFGGSLSVVYRTSTAGSTQTDTTVTRSAFSDDKLDGTGDSGFTLNTGVMNTYVVDLTFAGSGVVRMGVLVKNTIVIAHTFSFGTSSTPFTRYPTLPVRWEIQNTTTSSQTDTMRASSAAVWVEDGQVWQRIVSANTGTTGVLVNSTTRRPVISIRARASCVRALLMMARVDGFVDREALVEVFLGGTLTGASWSSTGVFSEVDTAATAISGGRMIKCGIFDRRVILELQQSLYQAAAADLAGTTALILSVCVSKLDVNANAYISCEWAEAA